MIDACSDWLNDTYISEIIVNLDWVISNYPLTNFLYKVEKAWQYIDMDSI